MWMESCLLPADLERGLHHVKTQEKEVKQELWCFLSQITRKRVHFIMKIRHFVLASPLIIEWQLYSAARRKSFWEVLWMPSSHLVAMKEGYKDITVKAHGRLFPVINYLTNIYWGPTVCQAQWRHTEVSEKDLGLMVPCRQWDWSTWEITHPFPQREDWCRS